MIGIYHFRDAAASGGKSESSSTMTCAMVTSSNFRMPSGR